MTRVSRFVNLVVKSYEDGAPMQGIDPRAVRASEWQERAEREFPQVVAVNRLRLWRPGDRIRDGVRVLIGVAVWSRHDMTLLDSVNDALGRPQEAHVDVFDFWTNCRTQEQLDEYVPGLDISIVYHSPVFGLWSNGTLTKSGSGHAAKVAIAGLLAI